MLFHYQNSSDPLITYSLIQQILITASGTVQGIARLKPKSREGQTRRNSKESVPVQNETERKNARTKSGGRIEGPERKHFDGGKVLEREREKRGGHTTMGEQSDQCKLEWGKEEKWLKKWGSTNESFCILLHSYLVTICCPKRHIQDYTICINPKKRLVTSKLSPRNMSFKLHCQSQQNKVCVNFSKQSFKRYTV